MRLGIFGGTFDPVHYGHLLLAESCREQLALDQVWFLPADVPPHKRERELTPAAQRIEMLELATGGHPAFAVSRWEIDRGGVNYTVDTLAELAREDASRDLFLLMGADSLRDLPTWKEPTRLCRLATLVVVGRPTSNQATDTSDLNALSALEGALMADELAKVRAHVVRMPRIDLSSSEIRNRVANGQSIRYRTPRAIEAFIETQRLYQKSD